MSRTTDREHNIKIAVVLNVFFTVIEFVGGLWTNSLAIISDALHDFGDSVFLITSWLAERKAKQKPDKKRTFGYQRFSLTAAFFSAAILVGGSFVILAKAIPRLIEPQHVNANGMILLAVVGIIFNGAGFLKLKRGQSANERVISWHLLEDVLGWVTILIGAGIIRFWDNHIIDPLLTIAFTVFILWGVIKNLQEVWNIFLQGVPVHIDLEQAKRDILTIDGVKGVHDVHAWSLEGETDIFTAHIVVGEEFLSESDSIKKRINETLKKHHIEHTTLETESERYCSGMECGCGRGENTS